MYPRHSVARLLSVAVVASSIAVNLSADSNQFNVGTQSAMEYFVTQQLKAPVTDKIANAMGAQADNKVLNAGEITSILVHVGVEGIRINQAGFALNPKYMAVDAAYIIARDKIVKAAVYALGKAGHEAGDGTKATLQVLTTFFVFPFIHGQISSAMDKGYNSLL